MRVSASLMAAVVASIVSLQCGGKSAASGGASASAISPAPNTTAANTQIRISEYKFWPETVHVHVGQVIRWTNEDNIKHNVRFTSADTVASKPVKSRAELLAQNRPKELYASALFDMGESWTARFDKPGKFAYICDPHPFMRAVVIVE